MSDEKPTRARGRPRTLDPDHVLKVAIDAYWRGDPADVSVNAICRLAGVSKPSLYREFGSEDGLTRAALERYAREVLTDVFTIVQSGRGLRPTLDALIDFAAGDARMETGCLFYKMRNGKHRLGPETRQLVDDLDAGARAAYATFFEACRSAGEWSEPPPVEAAARYLSEQVALAITQRASSEDPAQIRASLALALSVFER
ncbi:MAG: TetR/AcrR family transcriptional regulator [Myxococcota bacterium]